jgi:uncharacterized protein (TIGR03083 family)
VATTTEHDYERMTGEEYADMRGLLDGLGDEQWDAPSLCEGWRVRHVIGHICLGLQTSPLTLPARLVRFGFNVAKASSAMSYRYGQEHTPAQLRADFTRLTTIPGKPGLAKMIPSKEFFADKLIHNQDIRRPLAMPRAIPGDHLVAALDALPSIGGFLKSKGNAAGLRLVATDVDHSVGDGPEVRGPAEAIILAVSGRPVSLPELDGEGVATLRSRISSAA